MRIFFQRQHWQEENFLEKRRIFEEAEKGEPSVNEYIDTGKQKLIELKENIGEKINNGLQTLREKSSEYVDLVGLSRMNNKEFLRKYSFEERISKITNPPVSYEDIQNGTMKNFDVSFTFGGIHNKELWLKTTAGQTFPTAIRKVKINDKEYSRDEDALKGEFYAEDGERLKIHDETNVEIVKIGKPEDIQERIEEKYQKYYEENKEELKLPENQEYIEGQEKIIPKEEQIARMSLEKGIDPKFAVIALRDNKELGASGEEDFDQNIFNAKVEDYLTDFGREEEVYRKNKDKLGYGENNLYNIHLAVTMMKKADNVNWKEKLIRYGYDSDEINDYKFYGQIEIENVPDSLRELMAKIVGYESNGNANAYNMGEGGDVAKLELPAIDLEKMTIGEIVKRMDLKKPETNEEKRNSQYLHAVGKFQFKKATLLEAMRFSGLNHDSHFTSENQDKMGVYLFVGGKRKTLTAYLTGQGGNLEIALEEFGSEFASVPKDSEGNGKYHEIPDGEKRAQEIIALMKEIRADYIEQRKNSVPIISEDGNILESAEYYLGWYARDMIRVKTWRNAGEENAQHPKWFSCYDYGELVYRSSGKRRKEVWRGNKHSKDVPYDQIEPGDWLYIHNGNNVDKNNEHSVIFMDWLDKSNKIARVTNFRGDADIPADERTINFSETPMTSLGKPYNA